VLLSSSNKYVFTRWIFLRFLGIIYALAFWSLSTQLLGLLGQDGILPANSFLTLLSKQLGLERYWLFPTLAWINASDAFLQFLCNVGIALSLSVVLGVLSGPALFLLWLLYLSFVIIGQDFLSFQWDVLLLETGFLAIFLAPWRLIDFPWKQKFAQFVGPSAIIVWLFRWLLFRLMLQSGIVKLASGDPTWSNLTALEYHYFTQPLPTPVAWYAAQLPDWFQHISVVGVFIIELILPFFIFAPRRWRHFAAFAFISFQLLISITGNYAFFNLLTIALCIMLLDDALLERILPKFLSNILKQNPAQSIRAPFSHVIPLALAIFIGTLSASSLIGRSNLPSVVQVLLEPVEHFYCVNSYGLFAVMTTSRLEIVVEGSDNGTEWRPYQFKYKPGELNVPPQWVEPCQPRLDWQMWFAALSDYRSNIWFLNFMYRLLQGSQSVLSLLETNPFPDQPPQYVRAELYQYKFTDFATRAITGNWWQREYVGHYLPPVNFTKQAAP
jgi:lipase maturation factor 1